MSEIDKKDLQKLNSLINGLKEMGRPSKELKELYSEIEHLFSFYKGRVEGLNKLVLEAQQEVHNLQKKIRCSRLNTKALGLIGSPQNLEKIAR